jgi:hypothetical protein
MEHRKRGAKDCDLKLTIEQMGEGNIWLIKMGMALASV